MALVISTWLWGTKYDNGYVDKLHNGLRRNLSKPFRFSVFKPGIEDARLTAIPGCFARLRMFSPEWQARHGIGHGDQLVCLDLDVVITGRLDGLFDRLESFVILQRCNKVNPCPFNGSVMMLLAGAHQNVWTDFSLEAAKAVPYHDFPDDQGWLHHKIPKAAGWIAGHHSGIYAFKKQGWPLGDNLPYDSKMVVFPGHRDPSQFTHLKWVAKHWR